MELRSISTEGSNGLLSTLGGEAQSQPENDSALPFARLLQSQHRLSESAGSGAALMGGTSNPSSPEAQLLAADQSTTSVPWTLVQAQLSTESQAQSAEASLAASDALTETPSEPLLLEQSLVVPSGEDAVLPLNENTALPLNENTALPLGMTLAEGEESLATNDSRLFSSSGGGGLPNTPASVTPEALATSDVGSDGVYRPIAAAGDSEGGALPSTDNQSTESLELLPADRIKPLDASMVSGEDADVDAQARLLSLAKAATDEAGVELQAARAELQRQASESKASAAPLAQASATSAEAGAPNDLKTTISSSPGTPLGESLAGQSADSAPISTANNSEPEAAEPISTDLRASADRGIAINSRDATVANSERVAVDAEALNRNVSADKINNDSQALPQAQAQQATQVATNAAATGAAALEQSASQARTPVPNNNKRSAALEAVDSSAATDGSEGYHWLSGDADAVDSVVERPSLNRSLDGSNTPVANNNIAATVNTNARSEAAQAESFASIKQNVDAAAASESTENIESLDAANLEIDTPVQDKQWSQAFAYRVQFMAQQGIQRAQVQLNPAELGPMEITVDLAEDVAQVQITAENAATREAVEQAVPRLREMMAQSGFAETSVDLGNNNEESAASSNGEAALFNQAQSGESGGADSREGSGGQSAANTDSTIRTVSGDQTPERSADGRLSFYV